MENCKISFFEIIQYVPINKIIFIPVRIYVRTSSSHRRETSFRNVSAKLKVDSLSRFPAGAGQVFTTQKLFPSKILLTIKTATLSSL